MPTLQQSLPFDLTTFGLVLFALTAVCFALTGIVNPGVPPEPPPQPPDAGGGMAGTLPHPGEQYSLSRDTNRYVLGFDHFCEFVGNDIGRGNLSCFVTFLVLLALLSTYVVVLSSYLIFGLFLPPSPQPWHLLADPWRISLAITLVGLLCYALYKCASSETCSGVLPLIMMMPGATTGTFLVILVLVTTVLLPLTSNMLDGSATINPVAFFIILPCLMFAVLFWGMSAHWVHLLCDGLTQKMWLKAKGYKRPQKPRGFPNDASALV